MGFRMRRKMIETLMKRKVQGVELTSKTIRIDMIITMGKKELLQKGSMKRRMTAMTILMRIM